MLRRYPAIASAAGDNMSVDIPQQDLDEWAKLVLRIQKGGSIKSLPLTNKNIDGLVGEMRRAYDLVQERNLDEAVQLYRRLLGYLRPYRRLLAAAAPPARAMRCSSP